MDCINCQDLANDSGQTEEEEDGIAFPELRPASGWRQLKNKTEKLMMTEQNLLPHTNGKKTDQLIPSKSCRPLVLFWRKWLI